MQPEKRKALIRQYAAGAIAWRELQHRGFDDYIQVLAALADYGLRQPIVPMEGPNRAARERGRALIREALRGNR